MNDLFNYGAKLVRVVDGDTVHLDLDLGFYEWRHDQSYRLLHINAPEMHVSGSLNLAGVAAKDALAAFLAGKSLTVHTEKSDNFGRYLVDLFANGASASEYMLANGFAVAYR